MGGMTKQDELPTIPQDIPKDKTPWLTLSRTYLGQKELVGATHDNAFIVNCFTYTTYKAIHDEVPWCAAFVCKMLEDSGQKSSRSAAADSFINYGSPCELKPGAILVFHWPGGGGHVTFCDSITSDTLVTCLGGNQGDAVKDSTFNRAYIKAIRWPVAK